MRRRGRSVSRTGTVEKPLQRADGQWSTRVRWFDASGKRCGETVYASSAAKARADGQRLLHKRLQESAEERAGVRVPTRPRPPTLAEVVLRAEREVLPLRQRARQVVQTLAHLANYWEAPFGSRPVDEISTAAVRSVLAGMRTKGLSAAYGNRVLSALSIVLEAAVEWGYIDGNPCRGRHLRQREGRKIPRFLNRDEAARVIRAAEPRWRAFFACCIYTGARFGEVRALRWGDLDLVRAQVAIRRSAPEGRAGRPDEPDAPKSGHQRSVPLHPRLIALLGEPGPSDHLVFQGRARVLGRPDPRADMVSRPHRALERALVAADIGRHVSVHNLRDTFATLFLDGGGKIRHLQDLLGHASLATTVRYLHFIGLQDNELGALNLDDEDGDS